MGGFCFGFGFGWLRGTGAGGVAGLLFCMYDGLAGCAALLAAAAAGTAAGAGAGFGADVPLSSSTVLLLLPRLRRSRNTAAKTTRPTRSSAPTTERATVAPMGKPESEGQSALRPVQLMVTLQTVVLGLNVPVAASQHTPLEHWCVSFSAFQSVSHDIP